MKTRATGSVVVATLLLATQVLQLEAQATVDTTRFTEREVTIGSAPWALPGTLTLPRDARGAVPVVVLVHGSGPGDRDQTVGPLKPFRDIAHGLAAQGIAVLRYDKRPRVHGAAMMQQLFTVQEEVIDDVVAATSLLRTIPDIDPRRIFVLGHSLGGYLIPRIAGADTIAAGFIISAGNARPLTTLMAEQFDYLEALPDNPPAAAAQFTALRAVLARVMDPDLKPETPAAQLLGAPGSYWLDLRGYDPIARVAEVKRPLLVLQGERDYQVTMADFAAWRNALQQRSDVVLRSFPGLNHLYIRGTTPSVPAEYMAPGHVADEVIRTIAEWVRQH